MRTYRLVMHQKIASEPTCICGAKMKLIGSNWVCEEQFKSGEPSYINFTSNHMKKLAEFIAYEITEELRK